MQLVLKTFLSLPKHRGEGGAAKFSVLTYCYINKTVSQPEFRIYKFYIIINLPNLV